LAALPNFTPALPEIFLAVYGMALLMVGIFRGEGSGRLVSMLSIAGYVIASVLIMVTFDTRTVTFAGMFVVDGFSSFMKQLVLLGSAVSILLSLSYLERERINRFEFPVLVLYATLGMMMMISAHNLISLYMGLELQSLALYVLASFHRDHARSSEAGLKYFVLGSLSSGMLLYGASMIYGFAGTTGFQDLARLLSGDQPVSIGLIIGLVFVSAGLSFKLSAVPFHMWTPDVYEGSPTPVTALFAIAPKVAAIAMFVRLMMDPFGDLVEQWRQIIWFVSAGSMILGAFAAIPQVNIKRLMAYSSIGNMGYALMGLAAGTPLGINGVTVYMLIYLVMSAGTFAVILSMRQNGRELEAINDLAGLGRTHPMMAFAMAAFMFSMAGIPPLAGFFGKVYVFRAAIEAQLYALAVIGVLTSVVASYYYLRIVKLMYFDERTEAFDRGMGREIGVVLAGSAAFTILFIVFAAPLLNSAEAATRALLAG
jgi:NADH-quinone oxidoreductase subunit N